MLAATKMSSKGQVVIPEDIRKHLNLTEGTQCVVTGHDEVVMLKAISEPSLDEFESLIQEARSQAKQAGLKKANIKDAIAKARSRK